MFVVHASRDHSWHGCLRPSCGSEHHPLLPSSFAPSSVHLVRRTRLCQIILASPLSSYYPLSITRNNTCFYMHLCRRIQSSLSLSGTNPRWSVHLHHRFVRRGPVELPLDARRSYLSALISTSLATTVRGHVNRFELNQKRKGSRTIVLPNMADKSNARSEEQHATTDALKLVNRLNESRSPYVGPCNSALCSACYYREIY